MCGVGNVLQGQTAQERESRASRKKIWPEAEAQRSRRLVAWWEVMHCLSVCLCLFYREKVSHAIVFFVTRFVSTGRQRPSATFPFTHGSLASPHPIVLRVLPLAGEVVNCMWRTEKTVHTIPCTHTLFSSSPSFLLLGITYSWDFLLNKSCHTFRWRDISLPATI